MVLPGRNGQSSRVLFGVIECLKTNVNLTAQDGSKAMTGVQLVVGGKAGLLWPVS